MTRCFECGRLLIASHNSGKVAEFAALLHPFDADITSAVEIGLPEPIEDGHSFTANAIIKARAATNAAGRPALADDSGLAVAALDGQPGIHSARWAGPKKDFHAAMARVEAALGDNPDRTARFVCALALAWPEGDLAVFEGAVNGVLIWPPRGARGFGYDPMFLPDGEAETFGEMDPVRKGAISHRADAFARLVAGCFAR